MDIASRAEGESRTPGKQLKRNDVSPRYIWTACSWETRRKYVVVPGCTQQGNEGCVQHSGAEEVNWRVDLPKVDGGAPRN